MLYRDVLHIELGDLPLPRPPRFLDQVWQVLRVRHYALRTDLASRCQERENGFAIHSSSVEIRNGGLLRQKH